jgi:oligoribonuclease
MGDQHQAWLGHATLSAGRCSFGSRIMQAIVLLPMMNNAQRQNLVWLDLEMTGLDPANDSILEIATVVTDQDLNELAVGPVYAVRHPESVLLSMDDWNTEHHKASGLWQRALASRVSMHDAERDTLEFLAAWTLPGASPLCGNSICQDRRFLSRLMPELERWFHYRNLDVSTLKELASRWAPAIRDGLVKENRHEALADIRESIEELRYYRSHMGELGGL